MKKQTLFVIAMILSFLQLQATVRTVSNHVAGGAQYNTLAAAYNAAVNGDTLLIEGTGTVYMPAFGFCGRWAKSLVVIGAGFNPQTASGAKTMIGNTDCYGTFRMNGSGSGSKFYGIEFTNIVEFEGSISNVLFEQCKFNVSVNMFDNPMYNIAFKNCVFDRNNADCILVPPSSGASISMLNCVVDGRIYGYANANVSLIVDRCLFLMTTNDIFFNCISPFVSNSIFMNTAAIANAGTTGGTWNNNMARLSATLPIAGGSGVGNIINTNPLFVNYTLGTNYVNTHDYALQPGSPAIGTGAGGDDIGVHGGLSGFSETGEPLIAPVMRSMMILNTTVAPAGTLNVEVTAGKPNDD